MLFILRMWNFRNLYNGSYKIVKPPPPALLGSRLQVGLTRCENLGSFSFFSFLPPTSFSIALLSWLLWVSLCYITYKDCKFFLNTPVRGWAGLERFLYIACSYNLTLGTAEPSLIKRPLSKNQPGLMEVGLSMEVRHRPCQKWSYRFLIKQKHDFILKQSLNGGSITAWLTIGLHLLSQTVSFLHHILKIKPNLDC